MKKIYVSHPFTGDEKYNREEATKISAMLAEKYPDVLFINPLMAMIHTERTTLSYTQVLKQCLELLECCDAIFLASPDWRRSCGCTFEYNRAEQLQMPVLHTLKELQFYLTEKT